MSDNDREIYINMTKTTTYAWNGTVADLPASCRKGIFTGRGDDRELDDSALQEKLEADSSIVDKLIASEQCDIEEETVEIDEVGEA